MGSICFNLHYLFSFFLGFYVNFMLSSCSHYVNLYLCLLLWCICYFLVPSSCLLSLKGKPTALSSLQDSLCLSHILDFLGYFSTSTSIAISFSTCHYFCLLSELYLIFPDFSTIGFSAASFELSLLFIWLANFIQKV